MKVAATIGVAWLAIETAASAQAPSSADARAKDVVAWPDSDSAGDPGSSLPDAPAKGLVLVQCNICHGLGWVERSGANLDGWTERIRRMIRAGAQIPPEQIPLLAEYLAQALPERPRPPPEPASKQHIKP